MISQTEGTQIDDTGNPSKGVTVVFRLDDGTLGSVFVRDAMYTAPNVRTAIEQRAVHMSEVGNLSAGS